MSLKIGITGGIGSGKSIVCHLLALLGIPIYDSDSRAKALINTSSIIKKQIMEQLNASLYKNHILDHALLAKLIFTDPSALAKINAIVHPEVKYDFLLWEKQLSVKACAIESAILFESKFDHIVDITLTVYAPQSLRLQRACTRDKTDQKTILNRMNNQLSDDIKRDRSDYVIYNDDKNPLIPQVYHFLKFAKLLSSKKD